MRVTLAKAVLAAGGTESPSGLVIVSTRAVQAVDYVRARFGAQFARGNLRHDVSFSVTRLHRSLAEAFTFFADHGQSLPTSGTLAILSDDRGDASAARWIQNAVLVRAEPIRLIGVTTVWSYSLTGGELLRRNPDIYPPATA